MTDRLQYPHIRLSGGPCDGQVHYDFVGDILRVQKLPPAKWTPPPNKPPVFTPKIGRYEDAGRPGRDGFWRFEWKGWY